jgi:sarcosine oxidase subunit beta
MKRYSAYTLFRNALSGHRHWPRAWRDAEPRKRYDVVIIGGGGHGLATAYYLAKDHGIPDVAVLEKDYLGGGNTGRNTQVSRSNYFYPESGAFYERSLKLFESMSHDLDFNVMFSQRGLIALCHSPHEMEVFRRWANAIRMNGIDSRILDREEIRRRIPHLNMDGRFPVYGGFVQERGGVSRHDAVSWAYARQASKLGVDLVQQCEVTGMKSNDNRIVEVHTSRGTIAANRFVLCAAGNNGHLAAMAGLRLPITSIALQAMVSEPVAPILDVVMLSAKVHVYVSQSDRGEIVVGGGADVFNSYAQRGSLHTQEANTSALVELLPIFSRLRLMRQWSGTCDMAYDVSPIVGKTPVQNLFISTGWGTGGYKTIPAGGESLAWTVANDKAHELLQPFQLSRFESGRLIDEGAASGVAH